MSNPQNDEVCGLENGIDGSVVLISNDGGEFEVNRNHAFISVLVKTGLEQEGDECDTVSLNLAIRSEILELIVDYMNYHKGEEPPVIEKPLRYKKMTDVCKDEWDANFIDTIGENRQQLYDLIMAANYMDMKALLHLGCAKVASLIKGEPLEKIKDILAVEK